MRYRLIYILILGIVSMGASCSKQLVDGYAFGAPDEVIVLEKELNEISGLQWLSESRLACIQDEKANVFYINSETGKIMETFDFGHNGDFEGIAVDKHKTYILRSDGHIFISKKEEKAKEYKFKKEGQFDFEGLCLDEGNDRLLVACKEHGKKKKRDYLFIYGFSLTKKTYFEDPVFKIKKEGIHPNFKASGIAVHPLSSEIYVLSSFSKTLLILHKDGSTKQVLQLNDYVYHQPEGISFSPDGTLYISNEKYKTYPTLLKLNQSRQR